MTLAIGSPYALTYSEKSTLAVRTGDGGIGILQILGFTKDRRGIRIRYKMLQRPKAGRSATAPATQPAEEWGKPVDGVQVRLRTKQSNWKQSTVVRLLADVRNQGKRNLLINAWGYDCEVEVDRQWYRAIRGMGMTRAPKPFPPGHRHDNIAVDLHGSWELAASQIARAPRETGPEKLKLTPGKHTIRVAFTVMAAKNAPGKNVRAISNPVEIEIAAEDEGEGIGAADSNRYKLHETQDE